MQPNETREERFGRLFEEHVDAVRRYVWRRDAALADDVVAETFLIAWRRIDAVPADALPWLIGVARNVRLNLRRSARRQDAVAARLRPRAEVESVRDPIVWEALARLRDRDREVLLLHAWEELDGTAIASVLGCSQANVSLRLHRARRRFAVALAAVRDGAPLSSPAIPGGASDAR